MVEGLVNSKSMQRMQSLQGSLVCERSRAPRLAVALKSVLRCQSEWFEVLLTILPG